MIAQKKFCRLNGSCTTKISPFSIHCQQAAALNGPPSIDGISEVENVASYCEVADRKRRDPAFDKIQRVVKGFWSLIIRIGNILTFKLGHCIQKKP